MTRRTTFSFALLLITAMGALALPCRAQEWKPLGGGLRNVSGIAAIAGEGATRFIVVHDNKREGEPRAGLVTVGTGETAAAYVPLTWPKSGEGSGAALPVDLEAICAVPGTPGAYVALESGGEAYHITLDAAQTTVTVVKAFSLPKGPAGSNYEGFSLHRFPGGDSGLLAVWAHRGNSSEPSVLYWGKLDLAQGVVTDTRSATVSLPWPTLNTRHISDLKIDGVGNLYVSSAMDPGDDGPFASALYLAGAFRPLAGGGPVEYVANPATVRLVRFAYRKVEAFDLVPGASGGIICGTDDESLGASVWHNW